MAKTCIDEWPLVDYSEEWDFWQGVWRTWTQALTPDCSKFNCESGTATVRPCHQISTSMSPQARVFGRRSPDFDRFASTQRRGYSGGDTLCLEREADLIFQILVPAHGLFLGSIGIDDDFLVDMLLPDGIAFGFCRGFRVHVRVQTSLRPNFGRLR